jgi:hypothetical protein
VGAYEDREEYQRNQREADARVLEQRRQQEAASNTNLADVVSRGGFQMTPDMLRRAGDLNYGMGIGEKEFYQDPEMQRLKALREQYAKGYSGQELGNIRQSARSELAGAQQAQQRQLASKLGRGGVGGARAAAVSGAQAMEGVKATADAERKMAMDSAQTQRQGASDLQDFIFRQKIGKMGTAAGFAQMGSGDYAAQQARLANSGGNQGMCCFIFLEARYGNGTMDAVVRKFRDENMTDTNRRGYYKLSEVLVPMMRKSKLVKGLVRLFMTDPLVAYGRAYYGTGSKLGFVFAPVKNFWLNTFEFLGGKHEFIRENGEVI